MLTIIGQHIWQIERGWHHPFAEGLTIWQRQGRTNALISDPILYLEDPILYLEEQIPPTV